jgi:PPM family protein phosphatase
MLTRCGVRLSAPLDVDLFEPPSSATALEIAATSVKGKLRAYNADHYLAIKFTRGLETVVTSLAEADRPPLFEERGYAMFVADGSGSQGWGAYASRAALSRLEYLAIQYGNWHLRVDKKAAADIKQQVQLLYRLEDDALRQASRKIPGARLRTSLTMVALLGADVFVSNVGHSRAFLFREGDLIELTTDHQRMERRLGMSRLDTEPSPLVTEAIGEDPGDADDLAVEIEHATMMPGDRLLLCTNGLTDVVSEAEIADALALRRRPDDDSKHLVDLAVLIGSTDDITAMVADYRTA